MGRRLVVTALAWLLGLAFQMTNGMVFTSTLIMMVCVGFGCLPWLPPFASAPVRKRRGVIAAIVALSMVVIVALGTTLPGAYEQQRRRQDRAGQ
jgi:hypothetical protein